jgi:hypothetical protein
LGELGGGTSSRGPAVASRQSNTHHRRAAGYVPHGWGCPGLMYTALPSDGCRPCMVALWLGSTRGPRALEMSSDSDGRGGRCQRYRRCTSCARVKVRAQTQRGRGGVYAPGPPSLLLGAPWGASAASSDIIAHQNVYVYEDFQSFATGYRTQPPR